ncbi:MAG: glycosyltransferase family 4 protein [Polyangiaceae bacterium]
MLRVLQVAYPFAPVRPDAVGGAEQILSELDRGLVEAGHHCTVIAVKGSEVSGVFELEGSQDGELDELRRRSRRARLRLRIEALLRERSFDLVHFHGVDFYEYLPHSSIPLLATLHLPPSFYPLEIFRESATSMVLNCVSESQHRSCPPCSRLVAPILNGIRISDFSPEYDKSDELLVLGRICPEKGYHLALDVARGLDLPLVLAGQVYPYPEHVRYFEEEIRPRLDERRRFLGPVGPAERAQLLASAKCVLVPSVVDETCSLVAMEALASATPVIAFRRGALPEVVSDGLTGYIVDDVAQMADAVGRLDALDPKACRRIAVERFSAERMVRAYLRLYEGIRRVGATPAQVAT